MITLTERAPVRTAAQQRRRAARSWWMRYTVLFAITLVVAGLAYATAPAPISLAGLTLIALAVVAFVRPQWTLLAITFFGVAGDSEAAPWYPVVKGMSSRESILFIGRTFIISPFEFLLGMTMLGWIWRMAVTHNWVLKKGSLFRPMMVLTFFVFVGLFLGIARGGNTNIALWEVRPLICLTGIYLLGTNLYDRPEHHRRLWAALMAGVAVNAFLALVYFSEMAPVARAEIDHLGDHQASLHANAFFVLMIAMGVMAARSSRRLTLMFISLPVVVTSYLLGQRRSAFIGLMVGLVMLFAILQRRRPRAFWAIGPLLALVLLGYVGAFWNSTGSAAFPAQAVKTVIAPDQVGARDQSSDVYRVIENYNVVYTIRSQPLTGLGFGQKFLRPIPNADISFFQWWEYRTHNSILWMWIQMGIGGFIAMLYLFASAIRLGTLRVLQAPSGYDGAILLTSVVFVVMYAVYAYVDIAWDLESMVFLGVSLICIANKTGPDLSTTTPREPAAAEGDLSPSMAVSFAL